MQLVVAIIALEEVSPIAPAEHVIPGATIERIVAIPSAEGVTQGIASQRIVTIGGDEHLRLDEGQVPDSAIGKDKRLNAVRRDTVLVEVVLNFKPVAGSLDRCDQAVPSALERNIGWRHVAPKYNRVSRICSTVVVRNLILPIPAAEAVNIRSAAAIEPVITSTTIQRIGTIFTIQGVLPTATIDEIVAGSSIQVVVVALPIDEVVACTALELVGQLITGEDIVLFAARSDAGVCEVEAGIGEGRSHAVIHSPSLYQTSQLIRTIPTQTRK